MTAERVVQTSFASTSGRSASQLSSSMASIQTVHWLVCVPKFTNEVPWTSATDGTEFGDRWTEQWTLFGLTRQIPMESKNLFCLIRMEMEEGQHLDSLKLVKYPTPKHACFFFMFLIFSLSHLLSFCRIHVECTLEPSIDRDCLGYFARNCNSRRLQHRNFE